MSTTYAKMAASNKQSLSAKGAASSNQQKILKPAKKECAYCSCHSPIWRDSFCLFHYQEEHYSSR